MRLVTFGDITFNVDLIVWYRKHGQHSIEIQLQGSPCPIYPRASLSDLEEHLNSKTLLNEGA